MARTCNESTYEKLDAPYYMISNSRWPDHYMDMGKVAGAGVTGGFPDTDEHKFHIRVPTTPMGGGLAVILTSKKWPMHALAVQAATENKDSDDRLVMSEDISDDDVGIIEASVKLVIPPVARPDPGNKANSSFVMIMGAEHSNYFTVHTSRWSVSAAHQDEGAGSYWYIHPALPDELLARMHAYSGTLCELNCGAVQIAVSAGSRMQMVSVPMLVLLVAALMSSIV